MSSCAIFLASQTVLFFISCGLFPVLALSITLSNPQKRFIAVGLVERNSQYALFSSFIRQLAVLALLFTAAKANPKAALIPMAGAPLTTIFLIAFTISSYFLHFM